MPKEVRCGLGEALPRVNLPVYDPCDMNIFSRIVPVVATLAASMTLAWSKPAEARPIEKGTFTLSAERITGLTVAFPNGGNTHFGINLLFAGYSNPGQFPRVAADYFIIDGLSLGGSVGVSYMGQTGGGGDAGQWGILPRIGYAFQITSGLDFWPRLTLGVGGIFQEAVYGFLGLEGAFIWKATPNFGVEFGPTFDVMFGGQPGWTALGANAGFVYRF
jgi:hypothetical protein